MPINRLDEPYGILKIRDERNTEINHGAHFESFSSGTAKLKETPDRFIVHRGIVERRRKGNRERERKRE